jgi:hypothetical protein
VSAATGLRRGRRRPLAVAAALAVAAGVGAGVAAAVGGSGGSASPAAAVSGFVGAFEARDLSAALAYIDPADRPSGTRLASLGNAARGNLAHLVVHGFSLGAVAQVGDHAAVVVYGTVCVPGAPCQNVDALLAAVSSGYDQYFAPAGPAGPTGVAAMPCVDDGGWYVYGGAASWVPVLLRAALSAPRPPSSSSSGSTPVAAPSSSAPAVTSPPLASLPPSSSSSIPVTSFPPAAPGQPAVVAAAVVPGAASLSLPTGAPLYLFGFATGGALPSSDFAYGTAGAVVTSMGATAAAVAMTPSATDAYRTGAAARAIAGVALQGFGHANLVLRHNGAPGASGVSASFSVATPGSLVVVMGLAAGEQSVALGGLPGLRVVTQAPSSSPIRIVIASAVLGPGNYTVSETTAPLFSGTDPANDGDLIAAVVLSPAG